MATLYYDNDTGDFDWATLGNWRLDNFTESRIPATSLPSSSDDVVLAADLYYNSGLAPTVANLTATGGLISLPSDQTLIVTGVAYFGRYSSCECSISGEIILDGCTTFGLTGALVITGHLTVNGNTIVYQYIGCDAIFNDSSGFGDFLSGNGIFNDNSSSGPNDINGNATFNDNSVCNSAVGGTAIFNDASYTIIDANITTTSLGTRTPYPLRLGINNSDILGLI
jgi:hypothetical protein